ncbi:MAG: cytochrome c family protein [Thermoanaerobaculales bacterium]|nr:cytochrome c family protein [Thermoanaerobaculales bacterium]
MKHTIASVPVIAIILSSSATVGAQVPNLFVTSESCMACHNGLVTPAGEDVSIGVGWRGSMMANAARDPYWHAAVRRETLVHPTASAAIQNECSACHMPMARFQANAEGHQGEVFSHLPLSHGDDFAADGVSCAVCHQIQDERLGERSSFTAGFELDSTTPEGERQVFGPFEIDAGRKGLMRSASRFLPEKGEHIQSSELCATCHTLITHTLDDDGNVLGDFPEQVPYLEWKHSAFAGVRSCQSCHMPVIDGETAISSVLGVPREAVSRHVFRGGNILMPRILNAHRQELAVQALPQELQTTAQQSAKNLQTAAASVSLVNTGISNDTLRTEVVITNLAGHKLPSAYPSRRVWIHFAVWDARGHIVFESGALNPDGSIRGNANDADGSRFEPHHETIDDPEQAQIYEAIMGEPDGSVTTVLLSAITYLKDNRLLPGGFDKATAEEAVAVHGSAEADDDFVGGRDRVGYVVDVSGVEGPFIVDVELMYQPIGYRWAHNLGDQEAEEIERFIGYYEEMADSSSVVLAGAKAIAE